MFFQDFSMCVKTSCLCVCIRVFALVYLTNTIRFDHISGLSLDKYQNILSTLHILSLFSFPNTHMLTVSEQRFMTNDPSNCTKTGLSNRFSKVAHTVFALLHWSTVQDGATSQKVVYP